MKLPASKSILNRLLVLQSFEPSVRIRGSSEADDVMDMRQALKALRGEQVLECGAAGTVLRFGALRASRQPGEHFLTGTKRLLQRPQSELVQILQQLGVRADWKEQEGLYIHSEDWKIPTQPVQVSGVRSSQYLSAVLLSAWNLPQPLDLEITGDLVSEPYAQMTRVLVERAGMQIEVLNKNVWRIHPSFIQPYMEWQVEPDMSCAFSVAALALGSSGLKLEAFPKESLQPDFRFISILQDMGVLFEQEESGLKIQAPTILKAVDVDLNDSPDLFPILAILCARASGRSHLVGAAHLKYKESDRLQRTAELLQSLHVPIEILEDGLCITGSQEWTQANLKFNPDQDHRLAMAAAVANAMGAHLEIQDPHVVDKSFPEFWSFYESFVK